MVVKICGIKTQEAAKVAAENGADFIGIILVPNRSRTVDLATAQQISAYIHRLAEPRPRLVGVFRNQSFEEILNLQKLVPLDVIQLHGSEPFEWMEQLPCSVIKRVVLDSPAFIDEILRINELNKLARDVGLNEQKQIGRSFWALIDSEEGGDGQVLEWESLNKIADANCSYILAGGLTPENVKVALRQPGCVGVDVSGGVETDGKKDFQKIREFLLNSR